ncbi:PIN domain-containing protein [Paraburkholderia sp. J94]|uniref:PIN domain-containing protein n=1 Tax=Paraburkholderia sp. J94 TaxID=2805441 RepID=UPI002AB2C431|nr:hypothetical protein [Paraburkholderia sp. J94]
MMLSGEAGVAEMIEGRIVGLTFQGRIHGFHTDDLIVTIQGRDGATSRALLQMKRSIAPTVSNTAFVECVAAAWRDYSGTLFSPGSDRICIVYDIASAAKMEPLLAILEWARTSLSHEEFSKKVQTEQFSSKKKRDALAAIGTILSDIAPGPITSEVLFRFAQHLQLVAHDLSSAGSSESMRHVAHIRAIATAAIQTVDAAAVWARIETTCLKLNGAAATLTLDNLATNVDPSLVALFETYRAISELSDPATVSVRPELAELKRIVSAEFAKANVPGFVLSGFLPAVTISDGAFPMAQPDSANVVISRSLDHVYERIRSGRYADGLSDLAVLEQDLVALDQHQQGRWYFMRGACRWQLGERDAATKDLLKAYEICADDPRIAAGAIRAKTASGDGEGALSLATAVHARFPASVSVWVALAQAQLACGRVISEDSVPVGALDDADVLQILGQARHQAGRIEEAIDFTSRAADHADATLFHKTTALSFALEQATVDTFSATFRLLPDTIQNRLQRAVNRLSPRDVHFWNWQSAEALREGVVNLAYAYVLIGETEEVFTLAAEARSRNVWPVQALRAELIALQRTGRADDALKLGLETSSELPRDALVELGQIAANRGDALSLDRVRKQLDALGVVDRMLAETFRCFGLFVLANQGCLQDAAAQILNGPEFTTIAGLTACARLLLGSKHTERAGQLVARAQSLLTPDSPTSDRYQIGEVLYEAGRYSDAADILTSLATPGRISELHCRLMHCLIQADRRVEGKCLLDSFPVGWEADGDTRRIVMDFGQLCSDWPLVSRLCDLERAARPTNANVWILSILARSRTEKLDHGRDELMAQIPVKLDGDVKRVAQIAALEIRHGFAAQGMTRLYGLRRQHMESREVGSLYFMGCLTLAEHLPQLTEVCSSGGPGTTVTLEGPTGSFVISLDPEGTTGLPETNEFRGRTSSEAKLIAGKKAGEEIVIDTGWGEQRKFMIKSVEPVYRRLLEIAREGVTDALIPDAGVTAISIPEKDGKPDLSPFHHQLTKTKAAVSQTMGTYASLPCTLGWVATMLGRDPVEVVAGWERGSPAMRVDNGFARDRARALALLVTGGGGPFVIDSASLAELERMDASPALDQLDTLLFTPHSRDIILNYLEARRSDRSEGTMFDVNGQIAYVKNTDAERLAGIRRAERLVAIAASCCSAVPVFGPPDVDKWPNNLRDVLSVEEYEGLLLAAERRAILVSVDERYRMFAAVLGIDAIGLQPLMVAAVERGDLEPEVYAQACVTALERNRTFVSLRAPDLIAVFFQGASWARRAVDQLCIQLRASTTEIGSAITMVTELLRGVLEHMPCEVGAFKELALLLFRAISSNPAYPAGAMAGAMLVLRERGMVSKPLGNWLIGLAAEAATVPVPANNSGSWSVKVLYATAVPRLCADSTLADREVLPSDATTPSGGDVTLTRSREKAPCAAE